MKVQTSVFITIPLYIGLSISLWTYQNVVHIMRKKETTIKEVEFKSGEYI